MATLEERVAAIEEQLNAQNQAVTSVDDDVHAISERTRAMSHLVQALSITQSEHTEEFRKVHAKLDKLAEGQKTIVDLLNVLIRQDDDRRTNPGGVSE